METFSEWLEREMKSRNWSKSELARRAGIKQPTISNIISGKRGVGFDVCDGLARAFDYPVESVYKIAGLLPPDSEDDPVVEESYYLLKLLDQSEKEQVRAIIRYFHQRKSDEREKQRQHRHSSGTTKPGSA